LESKIFFLKIKKGEDFTKMPEFIIFKEINKTGIIILNRPKALNALNLEMAVKLKNQLMLWKKDQNIKRVLIKGNRFAFCAGGDIKSICISKKNSSLRKNFFKQEYELNYLIQSFSKPYLAIWNGVVMGGGVGLSVYGKYRITTENAKFAMPESAIGFFPDVGTSYILSRMKKSMGLFIALTGYILNYFEIYKLGLANKFVEMDNLENFEKNFIENGKIISNSIDNFSNNKSEIINNIGRINKHFSTKNINNIFNNLMSDDTPFSKKILGILVKRCPMSLAITFEMINRAKKKSFKDCLHMDYHLSQIMINRKDFEIGVNEVLINKTYNQKWDPPLINEITSKIKENFNNISTKKLNLDIG